MTWGIRQTRRFARAYKKLHAALAAEVDGAVAQIALDPDIGEQKRGDLSALWVFKFRCQGQLYLLGYTRADSVRLVYLEAMVEAMGSHENFYRDIKRTGV